MAPPVIPAASGGSGGCGARSARAVPAELEHREECLLRDLDAAYLLHALLAGLLLLEQLALAAHIAAVALGDHVRADRGLDRDLELLTWDLPAKALGEGPARTVGLVRVRDHREGVDLVAGQQDVQL